MIAAALILVPIVAGFLLYALPRSAGRASSIIAAAVAFLTFLAASPSLRSPDASVRWLARPFTAAFHVGFNPLSYWIVVLLAIVTFSAALAISGPRSRDLAAQLLVLQGAMNGLFLSKDVLLFALFWDLQLIPVFLVMIQSGRHPRAAWKYLIYNVAGGLALLLATAAFGVVTGSTDVIGTTLAPGTVGTTWGLWIFAGFAIAFLIKTPVFPFHTWMPDTYAELPPAFVASVSAVQSKGGLYGFIAIVLPFLGVEALEYRSLMFVLGLIALFYGALTALAENDAKRVVAYSSLSHLGLILLAIFSGQQLALEGAAVYIVAHGFFSAATFLALGAVEEREETRDLRRLGGLGARNPKLAGALLLGALAALGLPGLGGFAGEILILTGLFRGGYVWPAVLALVPIVLASAYMLRLYQGVMNGPTLPDLPERPDIGWREGLAVAPLAVGFFWLGIYPGDVIEVTSHLAAPAAATVTGSLVEAPRVVGSR